MTKSRLKTIFLIVGSVLLIVLIVGLIAGLVTKNKKDNTISKDPVVASGKIVDGDGKELLMSATYAMPMSMTFSGLEQNTVAQITLTATIIPDNATNNRVLWEIIDTADNGSCISANIEPTFYGSSTAVLTVTDVFDSTYKIIAKAEADETIYDTCYVDYLKEFNWVDMYVSTDGNDLVFGKNEIIAVDYSDKDIGGSVSGDLEYGEFAMELSSELIYDIGQRLSIDEFIPIYQPVNGNFSDNGIPYYLSSPYECFAKGSGISADEFNLAFCRSVYFYEGEYSPVSISFTAKYSYKGKVITTERIYTDNSYEKLYMNFSLEGLYVPVEDIIINNGDIVINAGETKEALTCCFDNADSSIISTDNKITVAGKQSTCTAVTVNALGKAFTKYLKMESGTEITFTTSSAMNLKLYVDAAGKKIKIDGVTYTSVADESGDNIVTVELTGGAHSITKGDVLGIFGLTLEA